MKQRQENRNKGKKVAQLEAGMKYPPAPQSKPLLDMEVANYCEGLDPSYSTLGFENAEVLYAGGGKWAFIQTPEQRNIIKLSILFVKL